jgi:hypothetical protein
MPRRRRVPVTPTIVILVVLFAGIYFIWSGVASPSKLTFLGFEIETSSVGLILVVIAVALLVYLVGKNGVVYMPAPGI